MQFERRCDGCSLAGTRQPLRAMQRHLLRLNQLAPSAASSPLVPVTHSTGCLRHPGPAHGGRRRSEPQPRASSSSSVDRLLVQSAWGQGPQIDEQADISSARRLASAAWRDHVEAFTELLTPESLEQLEEDLEPAELQQLQLIMQDIQYLARSRAAGGDHAAGVRMEGTGGMAVLPLVSGGEAAASRSAADAQPSVDEVRMMQAAQLSVLQLPSDFVR
jgi:hypothetical protein